VVVSAHPDLVLDRDPARMNLGEAVRCVLSIHTNVALIVVSSLGYCSRRVVAARAR